MRLDQPIDVMGKFWLPEQSEEDGVTGRLTIEDGGNIRLKVFGCFKDFNAYNFCDKEIRFQVVGIIRTNFAVTLQSCFITSYTPATPIGDDIVLSAGFALLDHHTFHNVPFKINQMRFKLEGLETWLHGEDFGIEKKIDDEPYSVSWTKEKSICFGEHHGAKIELILKTDWSSDNNTVTVNKLPFFKISASEPTDLGNFLSITQDLCQFISFACNRILTIKNVIVYFGANVYKGATKIYYSSMHYMPATISSLPCEYLFLLKEIKDNIVSVLKNWFVLCNHIDTALELFFSIQTTKTNLPASPFLALTQALESFAKYRCPDDKAENKKFEEIRNEVLSLVDDEEKKDLLKRKLNGVMGKSFKVRLTEFLEPLKELKFKNEKLWVDDDKFDKFIANLIRNRNRYTHTGKSDKDPWAAMFELTYLTQKAETIFKIMLLLNLGFTIEKIESKDTLIEKLK